MLSSIERSRPEAVCTEISAGFLLPLEVSSSDEHRVVALAALQRPAQHIMLLSRSRRCLPLRHAGRACSHPEALPYLPALRHAEVLLTEPAGTMQVEGLRELDALGGLNLDDGLLQPLGRRQTGM